MVKQEGNPIATLFDLPLSDSTSAEVTRTHYEGHLGRIARSMLEDYDLVMGGKRYTMLEVEAYLTAPNHGHADPYCHGHPRQKRAGYWFFHMAGMSDSFRGGSRKGVDITVGNPDHDSAGGMLIRAVLNQSTGSVIEGPSLLVDEILRVCKHKDLKSLTKAPWSGQCWSDKSLFYLEKKPSPTKRQKVERKVYSSCRVGLGLGNRLPSIEARLLFVGRPYRFVMQPWLLKKGRIWTVFGMFEQSMTNEEIVELTKVKEGLLPKYKSEYDAGEEAPEDTIRECLNGKDIVSGSANWKMRVMSAVRWWECHAKEGEKFRWEE
ncbi:hypothetical protein BDB00DRAFT_785602 [Zychaea mexicana]|uniref:uncharacterized protein n=1 Tax=Zychaea mexicana TaxID=64656 RepID=UPI0022FDE9BE|nr:uncharacterized protein BDB00DRAFT_785602 [Zychaea mexicana]KAI9496526.1 hypothetical protein BDB00DRAFT_785602 [Zychaea mexicana]